MEPTYKYEWQAKFAAKYGERPHDPAAFKAKLDSWRRTDGVPVVFPYGGRDVFHGPTVTERVRKHRSELDAAGMTYEPAGARWV